MLTAYKIKMRAVKIKNINISFMKKPCVVKGRIKYLKVENNRNSIGSHLNAIIFDDSSEIEVVAFKNCENISKLLKVNNVVTIENGVLREVNREFKKTKHKYQIILDSTSIITIINNHDVNNDEFPVHKYTSGAELLNLTTGMIIDVIGVCIQIDKEKLVNAQNQTFRKAKMTVDSIPTEVRFFDDKADEPYNIGSTLFMTNVKYNNFKGSIHLYVGNSSFVKINPQQLSNGINIEQLHLQQLEKVKKFCQDSTIELPEPRLSTSSITQPNKISDLVDESVDQKPSTSGSTLSNKRKTQDFKDEEVTSKILRLAEPEESFSDERFVNTVINFMQTVNNNKNVIQLRILEFISKILKENENERS